MAERIEFTLNKNVNKTVNQSINQSISHSVNNNNKNNTKYEFRKCDMGKRAFARFCGQPFLHGIF